MVWQSSQCSSMSCSDCKSFLCRCSGRYVNRDTLVVDKKPEAFKDAYWEINSLRIYTPEVNSN